MASTSTPSLRLELQGTGENTNSWGTKLNGAALALLDTAIAGRTAFTLSGTKTLTSTNYVADESRAAFLDITGGTGGTVTIPSVSKLYFVRNGASGNVTVTTGSGTTAIYTPGTISMCGCDGTNVYLARILDLGSSLLTTTGTPSLSAHLTTKVYVDNAISLAVGGSLPSSTGTGAVVLQTGPTIAGPTTTGKLTTAASTTGAAGLNAPHGTAPTAPADGDVWSTTSGFFGRVNGATVAFGSAFPASGIPNSTGSAWGTSYSTSGSGSAVALANSPTFTGTPAAPTASNGTNTTQLATCAFVLANAGAMTYPGAGIAVSTGSAWGTSLSSTAPAFTTSITTPIHYGGTAASSELRLQSTSGSGTTDKITFYTASGTKRGEIETGGTWNIGPFNSGGAYYGLNINSTLSGNTTASGIQNGVVFSSSVTGTGSVFRSQPETAAASFTVTSLVHFGAVNVSLGATSAVTTQSAFNTGTLSSGGTNYGFQGVVIASGTSNWNAYMSGTAPNYFNGYTVMGTTTQRGSNKLTVTGGTATDTVTTTGYTVATLPTGAEGMRAHVTDATAPTFLGALTGGGAVKCPVFHNGSAWVVG